MAEHDTTETDKHMAQRSLALRDLVNSPSGREFLFDLLEECGWGRTPYRENARDTAFACGQFYIGERLAIMLEEAGVDIFTQIMKEVQDGRRNRTDDVTGGYGRQDSGNDD